MVEIKNLTRRFGSTTAVNNLSFTVKENEILGFLGPNGAGKSTTMNMIAGCLPPTSGTVIVNGHDILKEPQEVKKLIGYLPEIPPLYTDMKVYEYLKFVAELKGVPSKERKDQIAYVMDRLKIADVHTKLIRNLSKGYKQRVGFAQSLLGNPKILILDEPTVGLDPNQILEVRELIRDLKKDHTIILSSHILQEVSAVCEHIAIIAKGELKAFDTIANLENQTGSNIILEITVEGEKNTVLSILGENDGVIEVSEINPVNSDSFNYKVEITSDDIRKQLINTIISSGLSIAEVKTQKPDLEQVFVKLTRKATQKRTVKDLAKELGLEDDDDNKNKEESK